MAATQTSTKKTSPLENDETLDSPSPFLEACAPEKRRFLSLIDSYIEPGANF